MGEPEEDESTTRRPAAPPGWRVITPPAREPDPADDELRELLRGLKGRRGDMAAPEETDGPPETA